MSTRRDSAASLSTLFILAFLFLRLICLRPVRCPLRLVCLLLMRHRLWLDRLWPVRNRLWLNRLRPVVGVLGRHRRLPVRRLLRLHRLRAVGRVLRLICLLPVRGLLRLHCLLPVRRLLRLHRLRAVGRLQRLICLLPGRWLLRLNCLLPVRNLLRLICLLPVGSLLRLHRLLPVRHLLRLSARFPWSALPLKLLGVNTSRRRNRTEHVAHSLDTAPHRSVPIDHTPTPHPDIAMMLGWVMEPEIASIQHHPADAKPDSVDIAHGNYAEAAPRCVKQDRVVRDSGFRVVKDGRPAFDVLERWRILVFKSHACRC